MSIRRGRFLIYRTEDTNAAAGFMLLRALLNWPGGR
jgi:hypothetical protein